MEVNPSSFTSIKDLTGSIEKGESMLLQGNIITGRQGFYGTLEIGNSVITRLTPLGEKRQDADLILAGFIDSHFHGLGPYDAEDPNSLQSVREYAVQKGTTSLLPTLSALPGDHTFHWLKTLREIIESGQNDGASLLAGAHMEGPYLSHRFKGGMREDMLRLPSMEEMGEYLKVSGSNIPLVTLAPELPGGKELIGFLKKNGVTVSLGHSECPPECFPEMVEKGLSRVCHLFDAYDVPVNKGGVRQPAITDMALINDNVMIEVILDGLHVPPELVRLIHKAAGAERIIGITDALQGAGLPEGRFLCEGRWYVIKDGDVGRLEENGGIVGSSLTMNRAFYNLTEKFSFTEEEASKVLSANPGKILPGKKGILTAGYDADIIILAPDRLTVKETIIKGRSVYGK